MDEAALSDGFSTQGLERTLPRGILSLSLFSISPLSLSNERGFSSVCGYKGDDLRLSLAQSPVQCAVEKL